MKAVVLAAGEGTRLGALVERTPKPMLDVGGKPVLARNIELLARAGIRDVTVNLHYRPEPIVAYLGDGSALGVRIGYAREPTLLGTAGAVGNLRDWLGGDAFVVVYGDNCSGIDLAKLVAFHRAKGGAMTIALHHRDDVAASGIAELGEDERIVRFAEKPREAFSHWANAGYYVCDAPVLAAIPRDRPSDFGRDVLPALLAGGAAIYGYRMREPLWWIDSPQDYARTLAEFRDPR